MRTLQTTVAIVGAGPAGLTVANLLQQAGIDTLVLEQRSRAYVEQRARAGLLEHRTVELLARHGLAERLLREGTAHAGCEFRAPGIRFRLPYGELSGQRAHYVYPQQELVTDLIAAYLRASGTIHFEASAVALQLQEPEAPELRFIDAAGESCRVRARFIAGCDGFHGVCRPSVREGALRFYDKRTPHSWVAILAAAPPSTKEIIYALHPRGFAGHMLRTASISRYYLQCALTDTISDWPDERIWSELHTRLATQDGWTLTQGPIIDKHILELRCFVTEPMQEGRLFLVGDAAHIISPAGGKGMNLAIADAEALVAALRAELERGDRSLLAAYSAACLRRVWRAQEFSQWMLDLLHAPDPAQPESSFFRKLQLARLEHLRSSAVFAQSFAENYVGIS